MDQRQIDQAEWANPINWAGPKWLGIYSSKRDSRTWVPKQHPQLGWTVNTAKTAGVLWLAGILVGIPLLIIVLELLGRHSG